MAGSPISAPIPAFAYPVVTLVTIAAGLLAAGTFIM